MMIQSQTAVAARLPMPVPTAVADNVRGAIFDEVIADAKVGDTLRCVAGVTGAEYFTTGRTYDVVADNTMFGENKPTIRDNEDILVPHQAFGRMGLNDLFVLERKGELVDGTNEANTVVIDIEAHAEMKNWAFRGVSAERDEVWDEIRSYQDEIKQINNTDGTEIKFGDLDDEAKGLILVAQFNGKRFQFKSIFGTWMDMPEMAGELNPNQCYRVRPLVLTDLADYIDEAQARIDELSAKMDEYSNPKATPFSADWF